MGAEEEWTGVAYLAGMGKAGWDFRWGWAAEASVRGQGLQGRGRGRTGRGAEGLSGGRASRQRRKGRCGMGRGSRERGHGRTVDALLKDLWSSRDSVLSIL
jgi:hypothetical protein